jgi:DNA helicase-2/ATP-dependent DNA helicase PcrA
VKRVIKAMNLDEERFVPKQVTWAIAAAKEEGLRPKDMEVRDEQTRVIAQVYDAYEAQCQREGVVDFAELMLRTYELMRDNTGAARALPAALPPCARRRVQDTNRLQYAWLKMFAGLSLRPMLPRCSPSATTTRASTPSAARRSATWRPSSANSRSEQVIKLERNYRSFGNILDAANELIAHNSRRLGKNLRTEAGPGEPVRVHEATSDYAEAQWFVDEAQQLHREGTPRSSIALLYAAMRRAGSWRARSSTPACRTRSTAASASSSAPR